MRDGATVVSWIGYAMEAPLEVENTRSWSVHDVGLREVIVAALLAECTAIVRDGLRRDYLRRPVVDTVLRGRLDIGQQVSRRYGQVDQLFLHRFDRVTEVWENLVCRSALDAAVRISGSPGLRRKCRELSGAFPPCADHIDTVRRWIATARYHRMNARYRAAHLWAGLLLTQGGVDDIVAEGQQSAGSLLINMNVLWERVVQRLCGELSQSPIPAPPAINVTEQGRSSRTLRPDAFIAEHDGETTSYRPIDAKYKDYVSKALERADTHQLLTYAAAFSRPGAHGSALVIHPTNGGDTIRKLEVRAWSGHLGSVVIAGVDTSGTPAAALEVVRRAARVT
jgi:5-methylcytosine-specific restriction enzyme subunit McrC